MKRVMSTKSPKGFTGRVIDDGLDRPPWEDDEKAVQTPIDALEKDLPIDEHALEDECRRQPDKFYRVAKRLALEISRRDAASQALKEEEARADADIRSAAELDARQSRDEKPTRVTEGDIKAQIRLDREVQKAQAILNRLSLNVGLLQALKEAFIQRSYALKDLVPLYLSSYYGEVESTNASPRDLRDRKATVAREALNRARRERNV